MKIISKGKYTNKIYGCKHCNCKFEIDNKDILADMVRDYKGDIRHRKIFVRCPECYKEIILFNGDEDDKNNN